jgi:hypothetical protein
MWFKDDVVVGNNEENSSGSNDMIYVGIFSPRFLWCFTDKTSFHTARNRVATGFWMAAGRQ